MKTKSRGTRIARPRPADIVARLQEMWVAGNLKLVDQLFASGIVRHHPGSIIPPEIKGREVYKAYLTEFRKLHPDFRFEVLDSVAQGDRIAYRYEASALNPATNTRFSFSGLTMARLDGRGKIAEEWITWDTYDLMVQVGIIPPRPAQ